MFSAYTIIDTSTAWFSRRLREVALHNRKLLMATNKREVDPLGDTDRSGDIRIDMHGGGMLIIIHVL